MPTKLGDGGYGPENYDPKDGKYVKNSVNQEAAFNRDKYGHNYGTGNVDGDDIFDVNVQSNSYVREYLEEPEYMKEKHGKKAEIVYMTPQQYYEDCAKYCFGGDVSAEQLKESRGSNLPNIEHLKKVIQEGKIKFPLPYIEYDEYKKGEQEGLHRMYVAGELFGWNHEFPVLTIKWVDDDTRNNFERYREKVQVNDAIRSFENYYDNRTFYGEDNFKNSLSLQISEALRKVYKNDWYAKPIDIDLKDNTVYVKIGENQYVLDASNFDIRSEQSIFKELDDDYYDDEDIFDDDELNSILNF